MELTQLSSFLLNIVTGKLNKYQAASVVGLLINLGLGVYALTGNLTLALIPSALIIILIVRLMINLTADLPVSVEVKMTRREKRKSKQTPTLIKRNWQAIITMSLVWMLITPLGYLAFARYEKEVSVCRKIQPEIKPASSNELLVLISEFDRARDADDELYPEDNLFAALNIAVTGINQQDENLNVRVAKLQSPLIYTEDKSDIVASCTKATIMIWGNVRQIDTWYAYNYYPTLASEDVASFSDVHTANLYRPEDFTLNGGGSEFMLLYTLGKIYLFRADEANSLNYFNQAVEYALNHPEVPKDTIENAYGGRGSAYFAFGHYDLALKDSQTAANINLSAENLNALGADYFYLGETELSLDYFNQAVIKDPSSPYYLYNRAGALGKLGDYQAAINDLTAAINIDPGVATFWHNRGMLRQITGEYELAIDDLTHAINIDPANGLYFYNRALTYQAMGNHNQADSDFKKSVELRYQP